MAGVVIARRRLLWLPAALAGAVMWPRRARGAAGAPTTALSFDDFVATAEPLARGLVRDATPAGQHAYVLSLAALAARLDGVAPHRLFPYATGIELAPIYRGVPFFVIEWRLAPNAIFDAHDHPGYSVCTVGLDGAAEVQHFELGSDGAARHTRSAVVEQGRVDVLSPHRDNVHRFVAGPRGARGIDITTLHGKDVGFHHVDLDGVPAVGATTRIRLRKG